MESNINAVLATHRVGILMSFIKAKTLASFFSLNYTMT